MQMMADVLQMPIRIHPFEHTCALGAAMFAATVAGIYPDVQAAMASMGGEFELEYFPNTELKDFYTSRYQQYLALGSYTEQHTTAH